MDSFSEQVQGGQVSLDEKDREILKLIEVNAKLTVRDIAVKINLSSTPTHERIKRMERLGVIRQYGAILDRKKVKKEILVICMVTLKEHNKAAGAAFIAAVQGFKEVLECYNISGDFDFMLKIVTESMESYHHFFVNQLTELKEIGQTKSTFVMNTIKETHQLL